MASENSKSAISSTMEEVTGIIPPPEIAAEAKGEAPGRGRLAGKTIVVIGGGSSVNSFDPNPPPGNGRAICILLAREGATVVVVDKLLKAAQMTVDAINREGFGSAYPIITDASTPEGIDQLIKDSLTVSKGKIDGLVIVIGIVGDSQSVEPTTTARAAYWDKVMNINLRAHYLLMQEFGPLIAQQPAGGGIISISSISQFLSASVEPAYNASKAGLGILCKNAAYQFAPQVRVNSVAPGLIDTPMGRKGGLTIKGRNASAVPLARQGTAWDIAYACVYLLSGEGSFITAQDIVVDGGRVGTGGKAAKKPDAEVEVS